MPPMKNKPAAEKYPCMARWLAGHGTIEFGPCHHTASFVRVLDEGGLIWKDKRRYTSLDAAMADCEGAVERWLREYLGENS